MLTTKNFHKKLLDEANQSLIDSGVKFNLIEDVSPIGYEAENHNMDRVRRDNPGEFAQAKQLSNLDIEGIDDSTNMKNLFKRLSKKSFKDQEIPLESTNEDAQLGPDGSGAWKVTYVHPDESNIGNDKFETEIEANRFARDLKRKGYKNVHVELGQIGEAYPDDFNTKAADAYWGDDEEVDDLFSALKYEIDNVDLEGHSTDPEDYEYNMEHLLDALVGGLKIHAKDENVFYDNYNNLYKAGEKLLEPKMKEYMGIVSEGYYTMPEIDTVRYQERTGLEGPFGTRSGKVVYYDPKEGKYYDSDSDMYLSMDEYEALNSNRNVYEESLAKIQRLSGIKR